MNIRYTALRGLPVRASDGEVLGRLADLAVQASGDEAVCESLLVVPSTLLLPSARLGRGIDVLRVAAADLAGIDERELRLRFPGSHYQSGTG